MAILTTKHSVDVANSFIDDVKNNKNMYYTFMGHPAQWSTEPVPPAANDSLNQVEQSIYSDLVVGKLIGNTDVSHVIPRYNWTNNTVYVKYDRNDPDLFDKQFYVMTDSYEVYKVIDNSSNGYSTVKPSLISSLGTFQTGDGYIWKYMYSVDPTSNTKFTSASYIPVATNTAVSANAVGGTIDTIFVSNSGSNYNTYQNGYIFNYVSSSQIQLPNTSSISNTNTSDVNDFYTGASIYLKSGYGAGQIRTISGYTGNTRLVTVSAPFDAYAKIDISNVQGTIQATQTATQIIDTISPLYTKGYFSTGDVVVQVNNGVTGTVASYNGTTLRVIRNNLAVNFSNTFPIRNTNNDGLLKPSRVSTTAGSNTASAFQATFNANSSVNSTADAISLGANQYFADGDYVYYQVASGNTAVSGLTANTYYFIVGSNATHVKLSAAAGGTACNITASATSESGHILYAPLSSSYAINDFIRVGTNANNNIRRITSVNTTSIAVDTGFDSTVIAGVHYSLTNITMPAAISNTSATGTVSNVNLNSVRLNISSPSLLGKTLIVGESVKMVDSANVAQGSTGVVAFANTSQVILGSVTGTWSLGNYILGSSSLQRYYIDLATSSPNIVVSNPVGTFEAGQKIIFSGNGSGNATVTATTAIPNSLTEYVISPSVTIAGDGTGAQAYAVVNTAVGGANSIQRFVMVNPGSNYTNASVSISDGANSGGTGALAVPSISPVHGHGFDAVEELGGRYVGIYTKFDTLENDSFSYPSHGSYRKVGILINPTYQDVIVDLNSFDRVKFTISGTVGTYTPNEVVINANTSILTGAANLYSNATGIVVYANSTYLELKNVRGTFSTTSNTANRLYGISSGAVSTPVSFANAAFVSNSAFIQDVVSGTVKTVITNSQLRLNEVSGKLVTNATISQASSNAYANVTAIYISNGQKNASTNYGRYFNQTLRLTLTSNTGSFLDGETVTQGNASGYLMSSVYEKDLIISGVTGSFANGQQVVDITTGANGYVIFANSTYLKLTGVSNNLTFGIGNYINNNLGANAQVTAVYPVLLLSGISGTNTFTANSTDIMGGTSMARGQATDSSLITYPQLVKNSGRVMYLENVAPINKTPDSQEQIKLVLKF